MTSIGRENLVGVIFQPGTLKSSWSLLPGSPKTHSSATEASAPTLGGQLTPPFYLQTLCRAYSYQRGRAWTLRFSSLSEVQMSATE